MAAKYVVFDGMDGSGKGTQLKLLKQELGERVVFTREPGGPPLAEEIRSTVRDNPLASETTLLFQELAFWAAREESMDKLVMPVLVTGKHVFSDRGDSSTWAFQFPEEGEKDFIDTFSLLRRRVFRAPRRPPDLYIIFDLPAEVARERVMADVERGALNHFDVRPLEYYKRVRGGFQEFAEHVPAVMIDATQSPERVHRQVMMALSAHMIIPEYAFVV